MHSEPSDLDTPMDEEQEQDLDADQAAVIWWLVVFQTLHSSSLRAVQWLLKFLGALLMCLGKFSSKVFPSSLYLRAKIHQ